MQLAMRLGEDGGKLLKDSTYTGSASRGKMAGEILGEKGPVRMNSATSR